jgi:predicted phosphodiesterase
MIPTTFTLLLITTLGGGMANPRVVKICKEFPDAGALTLAKKLHADHPLEFVTVEKARSAVRSYLGNNGGKTRGAAERAGRSRPARKPGEMPALPVAVEENWTPYEIDAARILNLSDLHIPHHSTVAIEAALRFADDFKPQAILLNGDILDMYQLSRFDKDPTMPKLRDELLGGRALLDHLSARFPNAKKTWKEGNHEERLWKYLFQVASVLADLPGIKEGWEEPLGIRKNKVTLINNQRPIMLGKLPVLHGHELGKGGGVNPARSAFLKGYHTVLVGHSHQTSSHAAPDLWHDETFVWSTGCLCGLTPKWLRVNRWNHGFAAITVHKGGDFDVQNLRVTKGGKVRAS